MSVSDHPHGEVLSKRGYPVESEVRWVRDQARFYEAMKETFGDGFTLFTGLEPACVICASDQLDHSPMDAAFRCRECGSLTSSLRIVAGRLTRP